jgi:uncharacterized protein (TIGR02246 family)
VTEQSTEQEIDPAAVIQQYVEAVQSKDLARCMEYFTDDAVLYFMTGIFRGRKAIEEWHRERLKANFEIIKVDSLRSKAGAVTLDAVVTSSRLRTWKINSLGGRANFQMDHGKIREAKFSPRNLDDTISKIRQSRFVPWGPKPVDRG